MKFDKEGKIIEQHKGFVVKVRDPEMQAMRDEFKIPSTCPSCKNRTENWDDKFLLTWGVCSTCYIDFVEGRSLPENIKSANRERSEVIKWVLEKKEEKENRLKKLL